MKSIISVFFSLFSIIAIAQQKNHAAFDALSKADMTTLSSYLDDNVELCFNENVNFLDKEAAIKELKSFLDKNPAKSLTPMHNGASKDKGSHFYIGQFNSTNGKSYRVFLYTELIAGKAIIKELRINKEDK
ncbi:MAG TPA: DUF4783 domain-containing protein [Saprospiraceae bacterium]|jgi:hypothetical protein|nr:DUF4783 domain-containing protein [Saprospiraceae bacterium]HOJ89775.1 DUF4783 domain-containing protein [Saprospiraceae bacterium]HUN16637.1 DUF4783 domain-containing protein [Saprospiraceae bacterium]